MRRLLALLLLLAGSAHAQIGTSYDQVIEAMNPVAHLRFSEAGGPPIDSATGAKWTFGPTGQVAFQQASQIPASLSVSHQPNATLYAPSNSIGNFEWNQPFAIVAQIHNWQGGAGTGSSVFDVIASKGNIGNSFDFTDAGQQGYVLFVGTRHTIGGAQVVCLMLTGAISKGSPQAIEACTGGGVGILRTGHDYNIIASYDGSGSAAGITLWINGFASGNGSITGNGPLVIPVQQFATGGAFGGGVSMLTPSQPLIVNGDFNNQWAGSTGGTTATTYDDVAVIPRAVTTTEAETLFLFSNPHLAALGAKPAVPPKVILDEDGCQDSDNLAMLAAAFRLHQLGYIDILGVNNTEGLPYGWYTIRKMMNAAGLTHVPLSQTPQSVAFGGTNPNWADEWHGLADSTSSYCPGTLTEYDANIASQYGQAQSDVQMYTAALTGQPANSVSIVVGGAWQGMYDVALTGGGLALLNGKVAGLYAQDGNSSYPNSFGGNCQTFGFTGCKYIIDHGTFPLQMFGGGCPPMCAGNTGPGEPNTRGTPGDGYALAIQNAVTFSTGLEQRASFDSWALMGFIQAAGVLAPGFYTTGATGTFTLTGSGVSPTLDFTAGAGVQSWMQSADPTNYSTWQNFGEIPWFLNSLINAQPIYNWTPQIAQTSTYPATPNLVHHWPTNEGSGLVLHDIIAGNDVTGAGGQFSWNNLGFAILGVPIIVNSPGSRTICAANDTLTNPDIHTPFSISVWFATPGTGFAYLVTDRTLASVGYFIYVNDGSTNVNAVFGTDGTSVGLSAPFTPGTQNHLLVTYDGSTNGSGFKMFLNGALAATGTGTITGNSQSNLPLCFGTDSFGGPVGQNAVANVEFYNNDQSANVMAIYKGWQ
jgi:hypothetical protein